MNTISPAPQYRQTDVVILRQIMERVGVDVPPHEFVSAVQRAFLASRERTLGEHLVKAFRACPSFDDFQAALNQARLALPKGASILVIGAGDNVPGRDSAYAAGVVAEVFGCDYPVTRLDLDPETIYSAAPAQYDLVVTHSLAHYFLDQESFYGYIGQSVKNNGGYVMGNEPNRRFWVNADVQKGYQRMNDSESRRRAIRYYLNPRHQLSRLFQAWRSPRDETFSFERSVNLFLQKRSGLQGDLALKEMNRITDPFFPDELPGDHPLGGNGIDWEREVPALLAGFHLKWIASCRHLGKYNPRDMAPKWRAVNDSLRASHPLAGNVFSAVWWKEAAR